MLKSKIKVKGKSSTEVGTQKPSQLGVKNFAIGTKGSMSPVDEAVMGLFV